jgi:hypothetical protein
MMMRDSVSEKHNLVPLADSIAALRKEIRRAAAQAQLLPQEERFRINEVEIELSVVAEDSVEAGAEVGWWIIKANGKAALKDATTHKVRFRISVGDVEVGSTRQTD